MEPIETPKAQIKIVGTSHIAQQSAREIERVCKEYQPDIIAVELDKRRLQALEEKAAGHEDHRLPLSMIKQVGATGYIFLLVGKTVQKKLGNIVKVDPGVDMLAAADIAKRESKRLELVDQDIIVTMKRLSKRFTFREKMRVVWDIVSAPFSKRMKHINMQLDRVPDSKTIEVLMTLLKDRYPSLYEVLIVERNVAMARNLDRIVREHPGKKVLLVIGAGHEDDLRTRLKNMERIAEIV